VFISRCVLSGLLAEVEAFRQCRRHRSRRGAAGALDSLRRLAEDLERMAGPIVKIAHTVRRIDICDREIRRLNATSASRFGYTRAVLSGAAPAITALFQDALVWDTFIAVAGLQAPPVVSGGAGAKDKPRVRRSAGLPAAL
jgi:hypothetical protein